MGGQQIRLRTILMWTMASAVLVLFPRSVGRAREGQSQRETTITVGKDASGALTFYFEPTPDDNRCNYDSNYPPHHDQGDILLCPSQGDTVRWKVGMNVSRLDIVVDPNTLAEGISFVTTKTTPELHVAANATKGRHNYTVLPFTDPGIIVGGSESHPNP